MIDSFSQSAGSLCSWPPSYTCTCHSSGTCRLGNRLLLSSNQVRCMSFPIIYAIRVLWRIKLSASPTRPIISFLNLLQQHYKETAKGAHTSDPFREGRGAYSRPFHTACRSREPLDDQGQLGEGLVDLPGLLVWLWRLPSGLSFEAFFVCLFLFCLYRPFFHGVCWR